MSGGGGGSSGGQGGKDALGRRSSMDKDMEAGKTTNCSGNCKEVCIIGSTKHVARNLLESRWAAANHDRHGLVG